MQTFKEFLQQPDMSITPHPVYENYGMVSTMGLITAFNPKGVQQSYRANYDSNSKLLQDIESLGCGVTMTPGMYAGHQEESFLITNITESDLLGLAYKHHQESVIWGYLRHAESSFFVLLYLQMGKVIGQRRMEVDERLVQNKEAFFAAFKTGRLTLPDFKPTKKVIKPAEQPEDTPSFDS
jgi:hypothetical protein